MQLSFTNLPFKTVCAEFCVCLTGLVIFLGVLTCRIGILTNKPRPQYEICIRKNFSRTVHVLYDNNLCSNFVRFIQYFIDYKPTAGTLQNNVKMKIKPKINRYTKEIENTDIHSIKLSKRKRVNRMINFKENCNHIKQLMLEGHPKLMLLEETHDVLLSCDICQSAIDTEHVLNSSVWFIKYFNKEKQLNFTQVDIDGENFAYEPLGDLLVERAKISQAGEYKCIKNGIMESLYHLDIVRKEHRIQVVENSMGGIHAEPAVFLHESNLEVFTLWAPWGDCTRCNARGERRRIGYCMVRKIDQSTSTKPVDVPNMNHYHKGVPCRSTALPPEIANLEEIKYRYSENLVGYCFDPCPTLAAVQKIWDSEGNVIEVIETGKGFRSMKHPKPTFPPLVKRKTIYQEQGSELIIDCPIDDVMQKAIRWQNGSQMISHLSVRDEQKARVYIDIANRLVIEPTEFYDTAPYSCWLRNRHIATIKIRIVPSFATTNYSDKIVHVGVFGTILLLFCVGVSIFKAQRSNNAQYM